jgi:hypothetical protein
MKTRPLASVRAKALPCGDLVHAKAANPYGDPTMLGRSVRCVSCFHARMNPIRVLPCCLAALLLAPAVAAEQLHKCVAADGHPTFQSTPCAAGTTTAWVRDYVPDPRPEPPREYSRPPPLADDLRAPGPASPRQQARARCRAARERETAMRRAHPTLDYERATALSAARTQACRSVQ